MSQLGVAGEEPRLRCPSCGCLAAERGFHGGDSARAVGFIVGESCLAWPRAAAAVDQVHLDEPRPCLRIATGVQRPHAAALCALTSCQVRHYRALLAASR